MLRPHFLAFWFLFLFSPSLLAEILPRPWELSRVNKHLQGVVLDYTNNYRQDNRIWCDSLGRKADMLIYLPPGFDSKKSYPLFIWMHSFNQGETTVLRGIIQGIEGAIACGKLPPLIVVAPDGGLESQGLQTMHHGSFFINSKAGKYEDYLMKDVLGFVTKNFPIRPEREAHAIGGFSMGGGAAYHLGMKHKAYFKPVAGLCPPLNWRYMDCRGGFMRNFQSHCDELRQDFSNGNMTVGRYFGFVLKLSDMIGPLFDYQDPEVYKEIAAGNPLEALDKYQIKEGDLNFFLGYSGKDQFNLDAQCQSFLKKTQEKGIHVQVVTNPRGRHNHLSMMGYFPSLLEWLGRALEGYGPKDQVLPGK
ncbi:MAG: hypothetical protein EXR99_13970 [Gemmataceae bacterium]|nr:hypothetical protein [Gemmataceae bacterium]